MSDIYVRFVSGNSTFKPAIVPYFTGKGTVHSDIFVQGAIPQYLKTF